MTKKYAEKGSAAIAALLLLAAAAALAAATLSAVKNDADDTRHYIVETRLRFAAESNLTDFVHKTENGALPNGRIIGNKEEILISDRREKDIRRRIYLKGTTDGITVYSLADCQDTRTGLNMFKQAKAFMEKKDGGYVFKYRLP